MDNPQDGYKAQKERDTGMNRNYKFYCPTRS